MRPYFQFFDFKYDLTPVMKVRAAGSDRVANLGQPAFLTPSLRRKEVIAEDSISAGLLIANDRGTLDDQLILTIRVRIVNHNININHDNNNNNNNIVTIYRSLAWA